MSEREGYNAILQNLGALGNGLAGLLDDGVGVVTDGASEAAVAADFDGSVHCRSNPRHHHRILEREIAAATANACTR